MSSFVHGHSTRTGKTRTYVTWMGLLARCLNPACKQYPLYGGAGITVCPRWRNSFPAFLEDMGPRPSGKTIDRIDNDRGYEPGNCRWATPIEQANNRSTNHLLTARGETLTITEWARKMGIGKTTIKERIRRGWSAEDALFRTVLPVGSFGPSAARIRWRRAKDKKLDKPGTHSRSCPEFKLETDSPSPGDPQSFPPAKGPRSLPRHDAGDTARTG